MQRRGNVMKAIKIKKVDFRMDEALNNKLDYIVEKAGVKRSSWCRVAVEQRVERYERDNNVTEEDYVRFKKGDTKAELRTRDIQKLIIERMLKNNPKCTVSQAGANYESMKKYFTGGET